MRPSRKVRPFSFFNYYHENVTKRHWTSSSSWWRFVVERTARRVMAEKDKGEAPAPAPNSACRSPCACDRSLLTERAGVMIRALARENFGRRQWVWCHFEFKLRVALGKGGSRCLSVVGSRSGAVTLAPLLPLCLAQRRYFFALDDANWMDDAPPRRRPPRRRPAPLLDEP